MNKLMKRVLTGAMTLALGLSLMGCGNTAADNSAMVENAGQEEATATADGAAKTDDGVMRKELTALELSQLMGNGINLGNTMEAYGRATLGVDQPVEKYETFWGQPVTTQEMISGMKASGFDSLRIPIAWTNMMDFESGDYTINEAYLDRVEEIINYARNEGMYVIINDHWDGSWWGMFGSKTEATQKAAMDLYVSMWTQIANRYKDYSDYLIFEAANEELGNRLNDTDIAKDSGALSDDECYKMVTKINQTFVDTVRGTGGNNADRFLLIAGYNTDFDMTVDERYVMPTDTADHKLLLSVHYYRPDGYCMWDSIESWGAKTDYEAMNDDFAKLTKFTDQGYGIIIGEYGVLLTDVGGIKKNAQLYLENLLNNCDKYNFVPMLWDTNGMYRKEEQKIISDKIMAMYQSRNYEAQKDMPYEEVVKQAEDAMKVAYDNAEEGFKLPEDVAMAWIMFTSNDWMTTYSVGDVYDPTSQTKGIVAQDVEITGEGTYTVSLDFTGISGGYANSTTFSALAIANGETLFPDYLIDIKEIKINGEVYTPDAPYYTCSDDGLCTRVNLYNMWIPEVPDDVRTLDGNKEGISPMIIDPEKLGNIETIEITFDYVAP